MDKDNLWLGILSVAAFLICSTENTLKDYSPVQLLFGRDTILLVKDTVDWELICQKNLMQVNKDNIRKKKTSIP